MARGAVKDAGVRKTRIGFALVLTALGRYAPFLDCNN
jgi:hypothetical protein